MKGISEFPGFVSRFTEAEVPFDGASAWLLQGSHSQVVFMEFGEAAQVPEHSHEEQWEFVLAGSVLLRVEGKEEEYKAGDNFFIPAGMRHSAEVASGYKAMILFNEPNRYKPR